MKRPLGVKVFGFLSVVWGLAVVLLTSQLMQLLVNKPRVPNPGVLFIILVGGGLIWFANGVGLLMLSRWAYRTTVASSAMLAVVSLLFYFIEDVGSMAVGPRLWMIGFLLFGASWNGSLLWYFLRPGVKAQFVGRRANGQME